MPKPGYTCVTISTKCHDKLNKLAEKLDTSMSALIDQLINEKEKELKIER